MKNIMVMISLVVMHFTTLAQSNSSLLFTTDSSTYWLLAGTMSWNEAQTESEVLGGHLVTLNSPKENVAVFEAFHAAEGVSDRGEVGEGFWLFVWRRWAKVWQQNWQ